MTTTPPARPTEPLWLTRAELRDHARWQELGRAEVERSRAAGRIVDELPADIDHVTRQPRPEPPAA